MVEAYIERHQEPLAREILEDTPVLVISGARQVGKSTLMRKLCKELSNTRIVNLDEATIRAAAEADPDAFADQLPEGTLAIDEIQRVPQLLLSVKAALENKRRPGRFILTGSSNLDSLKGSEESLAGRAETLHLRGFSQGEILDSADDFVSFAMQITTSTTSIIAPSTYEFTRKDYLTTIVRTFFPDPYLHKPQRQNRWLRGYIQRVLSKDAQNLDVVKYPERLHILLKWFAANPANELVFSHLARDLDLPGRSMPAYVKALRDVFLVDQIPPWSHNQLKRVIGRPKTVFQDTALAAHYSGIDTEGLSRNIATNLTGDLVENFVYSELAKQQGWSKIDYDIFHYRDRDGNEVDLVIEDRARNIVGIEVKATTTLSAKHFKGLRYLQAKTGQQFRCGIVIYLGKECLRFGPGLWALPLEALWNNPFITQLTSLSVHS